MKPGRRRSELQIRQSAKGASPVGKRKNYSRVSTKAGKKQKTTSRSRGQLQRVLSSAIEKHRNSRGGDVSDPVENMVINRRGIASNPGDVSEDDDDYYSEDEENGNGVWFRYKDKMYIFFDHEFEILTRGEKAYYKDNFEELRITIPEAQEAKNHYMIAMEQAAPPYNTPTVSDTYYVANSVAPKANSNQEVKKLPDDAMRVPANEGGQKELEKQLREEDERLREWRIALDAEHTPPMERLRKLLKQKKYPP